jgi:3',5'-cyclic AMP phosphodiesterase CpdA
MIALAGCGGGEKAQPPDYLLSDSAYTTLQAVWEPLVPPAATQAMIDDSSLKATDHDRFAELGLGVRLAAGNGWIERLELAPGFTAGSAGDRRSLLYIWQAADPQIIDEESPIRLEGFEGLYRSHGHLTTQVFEAHVRSAQRISDLSGRPFDFGVVAGDLSDGGQLNELRWMLTIMNGGIVDPDSGYDDDPVDGPGNDYNDPFRSDGLDVPLYVALGNHDAMYNGGFDVVDEELREAAQGSSVYDFPLFTNGFRDGSTVNADVVLDGRAQPDPERTPLYLEEAVEQVQNAGVFPSKDGKSYYSVKPLEGKPIRLVVLCTINSNPTGIGRGSQGHLDQQQFQWLQAELDAADAANELLIVLSHHKTDDFVEDSPVSGIELATVLEASQGTVLHLTGHGHRNKNAVFPQPQGGADEFGYWELMQASTIDFPMQSRIIEIVDEGNGYLSVCCTNLDHNSTEDSLAHYGRRTGAGRRSFQGITDAYGDVEALWAADLPAQNLLLRIPIPQDLRNELAKHDWPASIESEETLKSLDGP